MLEELRMETCYVILNKNKKSFFIQFYPFYLQVYQYCNEHLLQTVHLTCERQIKPVLFCNTMTSLA